MAVIAYISCLTPRTSRSVCRTRFPILVERLALAQDSGGPGKHRGGFGYQKDVRALQEVEFISTADRSILSCYGVKGGKAGQPYRPL